MELSLTKEQRQVGHAAATNGDRLALTSVCVRNGKLLAADGYMLAETKLDSHSNPGDVDVLIPAKDVLKTKDCRHTGRAHFIQNGTDEIKVLDNDGQRILTPITGTFPDFDRLAPTADTVLTIGMSHDVLAKVLKVMGKGTIGKFTFYGPGSPVKFEVIASETETQGLFMPAAIKI